MSASCVIVTDFDGTLTEKDVGNELCREVIGPRFKELHASYKAGGLDLRTMQQKLWLGFPLSEKAFRERALHHGRLRPGVIEFLEKCVDDEIPVYVASCGLRPYIDVVLNAKLSPKALKAIREVRCNEATFDAEKISTFTAPDDASVSKYPLDKGAWCEALRITHPGKKVIAIGNGTSDHSFAGHADRLLATEGLATWCEKNNVPFEPFEDFFDIKVG